MIHSQPCEPFPSATHTDAKSCVGSECPWQAVVLLLLIPAAGATLGSPDPTEPPTQNRVLYQWAPGWQRNKLSSCRACTAEGCPHVVVCGCMHGILGLSNSFGDSTNLSSLRPINMILLLEEDYIATDFPKTQASLYKRHCQELSVIQILTHRSSHTRGELKERLRGHMADWSCKMK